MCYMVCKPLSTHVIHIQTAMKIPNASDKGETGLKSSPYRKKTV